LIIALSTETPGIWQGAKSILAVEIGEEEKFDGFRPGRLEKVFAKD